MKLSRVVLVDTREQRPWFGGPVRGFEFETARATLPTGDYTLDGLHERVLVERKSLPDLLNCVTRDRERFERELQRLADATEERWLFVEASRHEVEEGRYLSRVAPSAVVGSLQSWSVDYGVKVWFAGSAQLAERDALRLFLRVERRQQCANKNQERGDVLRTCPTRSGPGGG